MSAFVRFVLTFAAATVLVAFVLVAYEGSKKGGYKQVRENTGSIVWFALFAGFVIALTDIGASGD